MNISAKRIKNIVLWNTIGHKRELINNFIGVVVAVLAGSMICSGVLWNESGFVDTKLICRFIGIGLVFGFLGTAGRICFNMRTKSDIVSYMMLPGTKTEKYISNVLFQIVIRIIIVLAAIAIGDCLQMMVHGLRGFGIDSITLHLFRDLLTLSDYDTLGGFPLIVLGISIYLLGGTFFRKNPVLFTTLIIVFAPMMISSIIVFVAYLAASWIENNNYDVTIQWILSEGQTDIGVTLGVIAFIILNLWLSHRFFCRIQVINNRFFN